MKLPSHPALLALLTIPSRIYGAAIGMRNRHYDRPGNSSAAGLPVLSVGNLTVGGTGKTPVVFGSAVCGDEPFLLASRLAGALVVVGSDRLAGARAAAEQGADAVILDDGFQHRRLARELDILVLDSGNPFGNGRLLPAGGLREPLRSLSRAGVVVITRVREKQLPREIERALRQFNPLAPIVHSRHKPVGFVNRRGDPVTAPSRAVIFCGIGNPGQFRRDIESLGIEVVAFRDFPDHHRYSARDLGDLQRLADDGAVLLTTEKDLVRLDAPEALALTALRIDAEIDEAEVLFQAAMDAIATWSTI